MVTIGQKLRVKRGLSSYQEDNRPPGVNSHMELLSRSNGFVYVTGITAGLVRAQSIDARRSTWTYRPEWLEEINLIFKGEV